MAQMLVLTDALVDLGKFEGMTIHFSNISKF